MQQLEVQHLFVKENAKLMNIQYNTNTTSVGLVKRLNVAIAMVSQDKAR